MFIRVKFASEHEDYGSLSGTSSTNEERVSLAVLLSLVTADQRKSSNLFHDVFSTGGITGRNKKLREDNSLGRRPILSLPKFPFLGRGVDIVVKDSFLVNSLSLGSDVRKRSVNLLKEVLVELLAFLTFKETTHGPGKGINEKFLVSLLVKSLTRFLQRLKKGSQQVKEHSNSNNFRSVHGIY